MTIWGDMKDFINRKENGEIIKRQEILEHIFPSPYRTIFNRGSVDVYRSNLTKLGILEVIKAGVYKKLRDIPEDLSCSLLQKIALDKTWKQWFVPLDEKMENRGLWSGK